MKNKIEDTRKKLYNSLNNLNEQITVLKNTFFCELISAIENIAGPGHYIRFDVVCDDVFEYEYNVAEIIGVKVYADEIFLLENDNGWIPLNDFDYEDYELDTFIRYCFDSNNLIARWDTDDTDTPKNTTTGFVYVVNVNDNGRCWTNSVHTTKEKALDCANCLANEYVEPSGLSISHKTENDIVLPNKSEQDNVIISITEAKNML
jgi:hypothetical protein